jgi:hypothetical protein
MTGMGAERNEDGSLEGKPSKKKTVPDGLSAMNDADVASEPPKRIYLFTDKSPLSDTSKSDDEEIQGRTYCLKRQIEKGSPRRQ